MIEQLGGRRAGQDRVGARTSMNREGAMDFEHVKQQALDFRTAPGPQGEHRATAGHANIDNVMRAYQAR